MSDFLRNLVTRSRGGVDAVQPRVPSLFEPRRPDSDLISARAAAGDRAGEMRETDEPGSTLIGRRNDDRASLAGSSVARAGQNEAQAAGIDRASRLGPAHSEGPALTDPMARNQGASDTDRLTGATIQPGDGQGNSRSLAASNQLNSQGMVRPSGRAGASEDSGSLSAHDLRAALRGALDSVSADRQASSVAGAVRPPLPAQFGQGMGPAPATTAEPPKPTVQVSIGRVEVRAVFPEPAARRPVAPRSRPTVSLDDYLNQRHRGKR